MVASLATTGIALGVWRLWMKFRHVRPPLRPALATALVAVLLSAINAATLIPARTSREDTRPVGARISALVGQNHLTIINPGSTPSPLHWRFYLTPPHTVVRRWSEVPANTEFLLVPTRQADSPEQRERLIERMGFPQEIMRFTDALNNSFALWSRTPIEDAETKDTGRGPRVHAAPTPDE
jgi:hypothetical protein